jgi:acyl-CoA synthetase (AMP-forming)/AMP-acid ligase II
MAEVTTCYGMTETSPVATQSRREDDLHRRVSTVGTPLPHVDRSDRPARQGRCVLHPRGYSVM